MPSEQPAITIPSIEVSAITEEELRKPGVAAKLFYKQLAEAKASNGELSLELKEERTRREQLVAQLSQVDARRQVLEEKLGALGDRNAISQLIWGGMALVLSVGIDFLKSKQWTGLAFSVSTLIFLGIAVWLVNQQTGKS